MPHPFPLASVFSAGMRRDVDRTELPGGSAYNMVDFIPDEIQAVTGGRGGWTYAGGVLSGSTGSIGCVSYHPDTGKVVAMDQAKVLYDVAGASSIATLSVLSKNASYHRGYLIFADNARAASPAYYKSDGTTGTLAGAPASSLVAAYKDHAILANSTTNSNRIWFSAAGDPTTWDTTFGWWDTTGSIQGVATLLNSILIFHRNSTERLRGTTPPPGSDMVLEPFLPNIGCLDSRSIAYWQGQVVFASSQGIYLTDGIKATDLTANAQMKTYWQSLMSGTTTSSQFSGGIYRDHYILTIADPVGNHIDCLCISLQNQAMWRFTNLTGSGFVSTTNGLQEKLYMAQRQEGRVIELSSLWNPSASVKNDGNGTTPTPIIETAMYRGYDRLHRRWIESMGKQKWRFAYVDYDLRDAASDNPTATLSYCTTPTGSYSQAGLALPETTSFGRVRRSFSPTQGGATHSQMLGLKFAVNGPYALANLYTLEASFEPIEIGAL